MDLWFDWTDDTGGRHVVVVEAKFNHKEGKEQLKTYHAYAEKTSKDNPPVCFFLTPNGVLPEKEHDRKNWTPITWLNLMQWWEKYLSQLEIPPDSDFHRFRSEIWRLILP